MRRSVWEQTWATAVKELLERALPTVPNVTQARSTCEHRIRVQSVNPFSDTAFRVLSITLSARRKASTWRTIGIFRS